MKARLIVNPQAGRDEGEAAVRGLNERLRQALGDVDIVLTTGQGDAERAGRQAAEAGYDRVYVAGGDGTLNEALNGVASVEGRLAETVFGVIPIGTGNDLARTLGIPLDTDGALEVALGDNVARIDLGVLNDRLFINTSAGGFIAEVSDEVEPALKTLAGRLAYVIGGARVLADFEPFRARIRGPLPGELSEIPLQMFVVCNGQTMGGGNVIAPLARIDDGLLDVCLVPEMPSVQFLALLGRIRSGSHVEDELVTYAQIPSLDIELERRMRVNTDGEVLETSHCAYRVLPRAAGILVGSQPAQGPTASDRGA